MKLPLVSIIVTTFQRPIFLERTLLSIINQTYSHMEIIVVDDGSLDETKRMVDSLSDPRIRFIEIPHSGRPAVPRNVGIANVSGELVAFCDDDDLWVNNKIERQVEVFQADPDVSLCYTNFDIINEEDQQIYPSNETKFKETSFDEQLYCNDITFSTSMIRKRLLDKGLRFDQRPILKASEDYVFFTKIIHSNKIYYLPEKLVCYRRHQNGISYSIGQNKKLLLYALRVNLCMLIFWQSSMINFAKCLGLIFHHSWNVFKQITFPYLKKIRG